MRLCLRGSLLRLNLTRIAICSFRPKLLPNETVSALISMCPTNPRLGCPYNTGATLLSSGSLDKMACSIFGDIVQVAPARMIAHTLARNDVPVYSYRFNHLQQNTAATSKDSESGWSKHMCSRTSIQVIPGTKTWLIRCPLYGSPSLMIWIRTPGPLVRQRSLKPSDSRLFRDDS